LDGPDEDFEVLRHSLLAALVCAKRRVRIVTPYFLPDAALVTALGICALRGVEVDIRLPARNNIRVVEWAQNGTGWQGLKHGCRVLLSPEPIDHSKPQLVEDVYKLFGSANWDARGVRLNFEFNVECYDVDLAARVGAIVEAKVARARQITLDELDGSPL